MSERQASYSPFTSWDALEPPSESPLTSTGFSLRADPPRRSRP